jgi:hypothetical protein
VQGYLLSVTRTELPVVSLVSCELSDMALATIERVCGVEVGCSKARYWLEMVIERKSLTDYL